MTSSSIVLILRIQSLDLVIVLLSFAKKTEILEGQSRLDIKSIGRLLSLTKWE